MNYDEACEATVSRYEARREIERHDALFSDFIAECGDHTEYTGKTVLDFLGY